MNSKVEEPEVKAKKGSNMIMRIGATLSLLPVLLCLIYWQIIHPDTTIQDTIRTPPKPEYGSYKEACLSGDFTDLKDLHKYVTDEIRTVQGALEPLDFLNTHFWKAQPVLMKGAAKDWIQYKEWTDGYLNDNFYDMKFYVDLRKHHFTDYAARTKMTLGKFLRNYKKEPWYLDSMINDDRFKDESSIPKYLNVSGLFKSENKDKGDLMYNLYLSSGDTDSPLHHDGYANLLTVLDGRKEWILAAPEENEKLQFDEFIDHPGLAPLNVTNFDVSQHPGLCDVKWNRIVVEAGDTLFVPLFHPHHVYSPPGRNMALGMWFDLPEYTSFFDDINDQLSDDLRVQILQTVEFYQEHVATREAPCELIDCTPLPTGDSNPRYIVTTREQYSRQSDYPPPKKYTMYTYDNTTVHRVPSIAYGTGMPGSSIVRPMENTLAAFNMGYLFVDTAVMYGNEEAIGKAVEASKYLRQSHVILDKLMYDYLKKDDVYSETIAEVEKSLVTLKLKYVDIMLIHDTPAVPAQHLTDMWRALEDKVIEGKIRAIGISNGDIATINHIHSNSRINISLVQEMFNPIFYDKEYYQYCQDNNILFMGFGITGAPITLELKLKMNPITTHPVVQKIAKKYVASTHAVLYNWAAQKGVIVISRSTRLSHMNDNLEIYRDIFLDPISIAELDGILVPAADIAEWVENVGKE